MKIGNEQFIIIRLPTKNLLIRQVGFSITKNMPRQLLAGDLCNQTSYEKTLTRI